jgi:hypothetical protein
MNEKEMISELERAAVVLQNAPMRQPGCASLEDLERHEMRRLLVETAAALTKRRSFIDETICDMRSGAVTMSPDEYRELSRATADMATALDVLPDDAIGREPVLRAYGKIIGTLSAIRTRDGREL